MLTIRMSNFITKLISQQTDCTQFSMKTSSKIIILKSGRLSLLSDLI